MTGKKPRRLQLNPTRLIWHIWTGFGHLLFLLALPLPAATAAPRPMRAVAIEVPKLVSTFTLTHYAGLDARRTRPREADAAPDGIGHRALGAASRAAQPVPR
ncbi:MAG: HupE/UreJ family protein [Rhizobacter sp.]|nr:HupE/UreJ family protein [Rhizobacter sp.]